MTFRHIDIASNKICDKWVMYFRRQVFLSLAFADEYFADRETAVLEYAIQLENGAIKYGPRNWQKGIPLDRYVDSGIRHYMKHLRGDDDERHDRAALWNMLCGAWTRKHHIGE